MAHENSVFLALIAVYVYLSCRLACNYLLGINRLAILCDEKTKAMQNTRTERRISKESSDVSRATDTIAARDRAKAKPRVIPPLVESLLRLTFAIILKMIITRVSIVRTIPSPIILWSDYILILRSN